MIRSHSLDSLVALLERHRMDGSWRPLAQAISLVENAPPWQAAIPDTGRRVHRIGVTGPPGAGKSTLVGRLIERYTATRRRVGVIAIDPSSQRTGGAVLGDRVRMQPYLSRPDVYVRSLATRGSQGALAAAARNVAGLLEASGSFDLIVIETAGAGQGEIAIASLADTVIVVTVPGLGDSLQAIKAGLLEVADLLIMNMADRAGATETMRQFRSMLPRSVTVLETSATLGEGIEALLEALDQRWRRLVNDGSLAERRRRSEVVAAGLVAENWLRACAADMGGGASQGVPALVQSLLHEAAIRWQVLVEEGTDACG